MDGGKEMTGEKLAETLEEIAKSIRAGDSMQGWLEYEAGEKPGVYQVKAAVRFGPGQGSMLIIGKDS